MNYIVENSVVLDGSNGNEHIHCACKKCGSELLVTTTSLRGIQYNYAYTFMRCEQCYIAYCLFGYNADIFENESSSEASITIRGY